MEINPLREETKTEIVFCREWNRHRLHMSFWTPTTANASTTTLTHFPSNFDCCPIHCWSHVDNEPSLSFFCDGLKCCWHNVILTLSSECQRGEKFKQAQTNDRSNRDPLQGGQLMSPRLVSKSRYSRHRIDDNPPDKNRQATPQRRQQPHHTLQTDTDTANITSTPQAHLHLQHRHISTSFKWHALYKGILGQLYRASFSPITHSGTEGKSELCVQREPTERVIIAIVIEKREIWQEWKKEKERKWDEKREERERKEEGDSCENNH